MRVVARTSTGSIRPSEIWKAARVISRASSTVAGSRMGMPAALARGRQSSSFTPEWAPGSSPTTITSPALTPATVREVAKSRATLNPSGFMEHRARSPAWEAPAASSRATISLMDHSACRSSSRAARAREPSTSTVGEPG